MEQNFSTTKGAGLGQNSGPGYPPNASWSNPDNITVDDGNSASIGFFEGGQDGDTLVASQFGFDIPDFAVIDGIEVSIDGSNVGCFGSVILSAGDFKDAGTLNTTYGSNTDLWGNASVDPATVNDSGFGVSINLADVSGGDGFGSVDYIQITVYWHIDLTAAEADVPTRIDYKVYSREGNYLGLLPNVSSKLAFPQDVNSVGSSIVVTCGKFVENEVTIDPLLTDNDEEILTDDDLPILATDTEIIIARGDSANEALFKNSNRVKAWVYNKYYPNGKQEFSGQINRVQFKYGGGDASVKLTIISDGLDLNNFIARGYPFNYTTDVTQSSQNGYVTVTQDGGKGAGWQRYGQTWKVGGAVDNIGAYVLKLQGTATVTVSFYDSPDGNLLGSITKSVSNGSAADVQFEVAQLIAAIGGGIYFVGISVAPGQSIRVYRHSTSSTYADGSMYVSSYAGGSGGGSWSETSGDLYFISKSGTPTTTTTYSSDDPVTDMARGILLDYNLRGGLITERDFEATGLSLTYTFVVSFIYDALKKIIELCPAGFYAFVDVGTAEIDIKSTSVTADFTVVRGRHINELDLALDITQVKNYYLFTGGETGGSNLYRDYPDPESATLYGIRTATKTDNRVTLTPTADAMGEAFIEENSDEKQETSLTVLNEHMDITLLTPGKTIGFRNFNNFIDDMVLQIVRREINFNDGTVLLTLGRLPVRLSDEIQRINRDLLNEQTINNPSAPS